MKTFSQYIKEEMNKEGYHKDLVVYHGTSHDFKEFNYKKELRHSMTPEREIDGYFFTTDANLAYTYAARSARATGKKPRVIAAKLDMKNPYNATKEIKKYRKAGMSFADAKNKAYTSVDRTKYDGVYHDGDNFNSPEYVAFSPDQITMVNLNEDIHSFKYEYWGIILPNGKVIDGNVEKGAKTHVHLKDKYRSKFNSNDIVEWFIDPETEQLSIRALSGAGLNAVYKSIMKLPFFGEEDILFEVEDREEKVYRRKEGSLSVIRAYVKELFKDRYR